jgi:hypothetical protein
MKKLLMACAFLGQAFMISAQSDAQTLLYKIDMEEGPDSYLFGTIHLMPQSKFSMDPKVSQALKESQELVLEMDVSDPMMAFNMMGMMAMKDGTTLNDLLTKQEYDTLASYFQSTTGMPLAMFNTYKPFMVSSMLLPSYTGENPASYELALVNLAQGDSLAISGLETLEEQMGIFDEYPYEDQARDLMRMVYEEAEMRDYYTELVEDYLEEDVTGLYSAMEDYFSSDKERDILLFERNKNWVEQLKEKLGNAPLFIAVGAGHLGGEQGLLKLLEAEGYTLVPVLD